MKITTSLEGIAGGKVSVFGYVLDLEAKAQNIEDMHLPEVSIADTSKYGSRICRIEDAIFGRVSSDGALYLGFVSAPSQYQREYLSRTQISVISVLDIANREGRLCKEKYALLADILLRDDVLLEEIAGDWSGSPLPKGICARTLTRLRNKFRTKNLTAASEERLEHLCLAMPLVQKIMYAVQLYSPGFRDHINQNVRLY